MQKKEIARKNRVGGPHESARGGQRWMIGGTQVVERDKQREDDRWDLPIREREQERNREGVGELAGDSGVR